MASFDYDDADVERFMSMVEVLDRGGCWYWTGARSRGQGNSKWYGSFHVRGHGTVRAHRFAAEALAGQECPPGHHRDHTCHFSMCVNPDHLETVTHAENERRRQARQSGGSRG